MDDIWVAFLEITLLGVVSGNLLFGLGFQTIVFCRGLLNIWDPDENRYGAQFL